MNPTPTSVPESIVFRVDASLEIGSGHVFRCLALAEELRKRGAVCTFLCRLHPGHLVEKIRSAGFEVLVMDLVDEPVASPSLPAHAAWLGCAWQTDVAACRAKLDRVADWLVVDHYSLDAHWEREMRAACRSLMVIDDLADRMHDCDVLLDQTLGRSTADYAPHRILGPTKLLLGPSFALLRPEFAQRRAASLARREDNHLQRILVTMGGVDRPNATTTVLKALDACHLLAPCSVTVVLGSSAPWLNQVRAIATGMSLPCVVVSDVSNMAELMSESDLAIGAAGSTAWERCCLGLPSLMLVLAPNQRWISEALDSVGAARDIGTLATLEDELCNHLVQAATADSLRQMSLAARDICDGLGTSRVIAALAGNQL